MGRGYGSATAGGPGRLTRGLPQSASHCLAVPASLRILLDAAEEIAPIHRQRTCRRSAVTVEYSGAPWARVAYGR